MKRLWVETCSEDGKNRVKITEDKHGLYLSSTSNSWRWTIVQCDADLLKRFNECITRYLEMNKGSNGN